MHDLLTGRVRVNVAEPAMYLSLTPGLWDGFFAKTQALQNEAFVYLNCWFIKIDIYKP